MANTYVEVVVAGVEEASLEVVDDWLVMVADAMALVGGSGRCN